MKIQLISTSSLFLKVWKNVQQTQQYIFLVFCAPKQQYKTVPLLDLRAEENQAVQAVRTAAVQEINASIFVLFNAVCTAFNAAVPPRFLCYLMQAVPPRFSCWRINAAVPGRTTNLSAFNAAVPLQ